MVNDEVRKSIVAGRDFDNVESKHGEYLSSFVVYSGSSMGKDELDAWVNSSYNPHSDAERMAEEILISGPTLAYESVETAISKSLMEQTKNEESIPVLCIWTFKNFEGFEGFALTDDYSSQPSNKGYLIMEGITVFISGVQKIHSNKLDKSVTVMHLLVE
jgi:hypothetical protein